jgi:nucleotide-binding universal stress UspA family protein
MYRSLLVPLDGSKFAEHALPLALGIARRAGVDVEVVYVHVPLAPMYAEAIPNVENTLNPTLLRRGQAYLDGVVKRLAGVAAVPVRSALLEGPVAEAVSARAEAVGAGLIVMTTHGRGMLTRAWLGSVADDLLRRATVPVLLVRPHDGAAEPAGEPPLRHVLIPLDGSDFAEQILEPAAELGALTLAEFTLLRVVKPLVLGTDDLSVAGVGTYGQALVKQLEDLHAQDLRAAQSYLDGVAERLRARSLRVRTQVVVHEQPAVAILAEAKRQPTDLIALATHGRSGLARLFRGSVADKVLRGASVPLLVHRPLDR